VAEVKRPTQGRRQKTIVCPTEARAYFLPFLAGDFFLAGDLVLFFAALFMD
jgi:hypothetical protein